MLLFMRRELASVEAALEHMELNDHSYTKDYKELVYRKKLVKRVIRKLEKAERRGHDVLQ